MLIEEENKRRHDEEKRIYEQALEDLRRKSEEKRNKEKQEAERLRNESEIERLKDQINSIDKYIVDDIDEEIKEFQEDIP